MAQDTDTRNVREIMLNVERLAMQALQSVVDQAKRPKITRTYPRPLHDRTREALRVVLDDLRATGRSMTYNEMTDAVNAIEPGALTRGGEQNDSLRAFCTEYCGIRVRWSTDDPLPFHGNEEG